MKKAISVILILALVLGLCACGGPSGADEPKPQKDPKPIDITEGKYPIKIDFTTMYEDEAAWNRDYDRLVELIPGISKYRGKLNSADSVYNLISETYLGEIYRLYSKLAYYAWLGNAIYPSDQYFAKLSAKIDNNISPALTEAWAFFDEEFFAISLERRREIFNDPRLVPYQYAFADYLDPDTEYFTENETLLLNDASRGQGRMENLYTLFTYAQPWNVTYEYEGETYVLDEDMMYALGYDPSIDRDKRIDIVDTYWKSAADFADTFAYVLETQLLEQYSAALLSGCDNTKDACEDSYDIPRGTIDRIIKAARDNAADCIEVYELYGLQDGRTSYRGIDLDGTISDYNPDYIPYDDGVDDVIAGLSVLGDEYIAAFKQIISGGNVDVYPGDNKAGGAFEYFFCDEHDPCVMFNYAGGVYDVDTIAHEMGHACYSYFSNENQPFIYHDGTIFTQEVASTTNEFLYYAYKVKNAADEQEKLYYIEQQISLITGSLFVQCFFQEFENWCHETVEAGEKLDAEAMCEKWTELAKCYYGENYDIGPYGAYRWCTLDHLYYDHYMFMYATSVCYAAAIANAILSGEEGAVDNYLRMLTLGDSQSPGDLLAIAGVDITADETYDSAMDYFRSLVAQLKEAVQ